MLCTDLRDKTTATRVEARINHPNMGDTSGLLASEGRECVSNATNLDTLDGISLRGKDLRVLGRRSPNHQWDRRGRSLLFLTPVRARETNISLKVLHMCFLLHR